MQTSLNVKLVAKKTLTTTERDRILSQLEELGLPRTTLGGIEDGLLISFAAIRNCYSPSHPSGIFEAEFKRYFLRKSTDEKLGGNNDAERLLHFIYNSGHCYDDRTEVLTDSGFKLFSLLTPQDKIAMVDERGTFAGFTSDWKYVEHDEEHQEGYIYQHETQHVSFGVTSQHRMFYSPGRYTEKWEVETMESIDQSGLKEYRMLRSPEARKVTGRDSGFTNDELELIGFFIGDGSAQSPTRIAFHLKKEHKIDYLVTLLERLGLEYTRTTTKIGTTKIRTTPKFFKPFMFYRERQKTLNGLELLEGEEAHHLLVGLMKSDGSYTKSNNTSHYCTSSPYLRQEVVTLAIINGIPAKDDGYGRISMQRDRNRMPFIKDSRYKDSGPKKVEYNGKTYCVTVPTGILVVRRDGKPLVCGNTSTLEHVGMTFHIEGVSRALLAQITRHRHWSFSVKSQRYVKLSSNSRSGGFEYLTPPSVTKLSEEEQANFHRMMEQAQENYDHLVSVGIPQEDARSVLPNAASTDIVASLNLASMLDFYRKRRPGKGAQWEIANLAEEMRRLVELEMPWTKYFFNQMEA